MPLVLPTLAVLRKLVIAMLGTPCAFNSAMHMTVGEVSNIASVGNSDF